MAVLTVSRLYGSGGSEVAEKVAKALGWSLLDNAVVDAVAARMGLSAEEVQAREERVPSLVERLTAAMAMGSQEWVTPMAAAKRPTDEQMIEVTHRVIEEAIARGPLVVVGRGTQEMLASREDTLHVFCYASRKALIARTMQREGVSAEEAARLVDETNKQRDQWVRLHWERDRRAHEN
ncbi:MAG TPA: cytidylate kinase-like family protein, partial [Gemmatimonadaceae bacterium]|nr:cytidylate kinase-like family protein [Gemmatimonadaceae bacterium]